MSTWPNDTAAPATRRLLLIDLDWQDADRLPEILRQPGVSVRLVAGDGPQNPGIRMADLCELPRTLDLADLTREIFDLALVGERSSRRTQLESLLVALGTPCTTPAEYLHGIPADGVSSAPGVDAPLAMHAAALEQSLAGAVDALIDDAIPDLTEITPLAPRQILSAPIPRIVGISLTDFPSVESREQLEHALKHLVSSTGAGSAELYAGDRSHMRLVAQVGPEDRLLRGLIDLAQEMGTPQLVTRMSEPGRGLTWAAWPFRTMQRRGVLAGAGIDPRQGLDSWQTMLTDLRETWDREDRERSVSSFPLTPGREARWLEPNAFRVRVDLAGERHRRDGLRFELHRLEFPDTPAAVEALCAELPAQLRDTDAIVRPFGHVVCLLAAGEPESFVALRKRLLQSWQAAWLTAGLPPPATGFVDRHVALAGPEDLDAVFTAADVWLAER